MKAFPEIKIAKITLTEFIILVCVKGALEIEENKINQNCKNA